MAHTKMDDDKGYVRGARGIDGNDGSDFAKWGPVSNAGKVTGDDGGPSGVKSADEMAKSAVGKQRKLGSAR